MASGDPEREAVAETVAATPSPDERRVSDRLARAVARARIGKKVFGAGEQVTLGRYELVDMVGSGGMGVVWGARDPELDRRVAVKVVRNPVPAARERMLREGQALAKLSHPNVVAIYDVGVLEDQVYLVMEWVAGDDLRVHANARRSPGELVAHYLAAGAGLAAIHGAGLVHRDFKPDNVIVGNDGRARVLDLGLCRDDGDDDPALADEGGRLTQSGLVVGTPAYMAPEQLDGAAVDARADQFAFCVSAWESLAGQRPHQGKSMAALRDAIASGHKVGADRIPRRLRPVLERGMAVDPTARFPSVTALLREMDRAWRRPRRIALTAGIAAVALGSAGAAYALRSSAASACRRSEAVLAGIDNPQARQLLDELRGAGARGRGIAAYIDGWKQRWSRLYDATCDDPDSATFAPRRACLEALAGQLETTLAVRTQLPLAMVVRNEPQTRLLHPEVCVDSPQSVFVPPIDPDKQALLRRATNARFAAIAVKRKDDTAPVSAELDAVAAQARAVDDDGIRALALVEVAEGRLVLRDRARACAEYEDVANIAERAAVDRTRAQALLALVECADEAGRPARVARATAVIRRTRDRTLESYLDHILATQAEKAGQLDAALALVRQARANWRELGATMRELLMVKNEVELLNKRSAPGDLRTARALLDDTLSRLPTDDPEYASLTTVRDRLR